MLLILIKAISGVNVILNELTNAYVRMFQTVNPKVKQAYIFVSICMYVERYIALLHLYILLF